MNGSTNAFQVLRSRWRRDVGGVEVVGPVEVGLPVTDVS